jgi:hypothetical protein
LLLTVVPKNWLLAQLHEASNSPMAPRSCHKTKVKCEFIDGFGHLTFRAPLLMPNARQLTAKDFHQASNRAELGE